MLVILEFCFNCEFCNGINIRESKWEIDRNTHCLLKKKCEREVEKVYIACNVCLCLCALVCVCVSVSLPNLK